MAKALNLKEVLKNGTPKQKALLIIRNDQDEVRQKGGFLTESEVRSIINSVRGKEAEARELKRYLDIADKYILNRFRFYGLLENLKKLSARIAGYCQLWEMAEQQAEFCNVLLGLIKPEDEKGTKGIPRRADVERYIYQHGRGWSRYVQIRRKKDSEGKPLRDVEVDLSTLKALLDGVVADYRSSLSVARAFVIASDEFIEKYNASAFVPEDVKEMFEYFKAPRTEVPEIYRRDSYLKLLEAKGADDKEVQYRQKYAILPAWDEVEPVGLNNAREAFTL